MYIFKTTKTIEKKKKIFKSIILHKRKKVEPVDTFLWKTALNLNTKTSYVNSCRIISGDGSNYFIYLRKNASNVEDIFVFIFKRKRDIEKLVTIRFTKSLKNQTFGSFSRFIMAPFIQLKRLRLNTKLVQIHIPRFVKLIQNHLTSLERIVFAHESFSQITPSFLATRVRRRIRIYWIYTPKARRRSSVKDQGDKNNGIFGMIFCAGYWIEVPRVLIKKGDILACMVHYGRGASDFPLAKRVLTTFYYSFKEHANLLHIHNYLSRRRK